MDKALTKAVNNWPRYNDIMTAAFTEKGPPATLTSSGEIDVLSEEDNEELWALQAEMEGRGDRQQ